MPPPPSSLPSFGAPWQLPLRSKLLPLPVVCVCLLVRRVRLCWCYVLAPACLPSCASPVPALPGPPFEAPVVWRAKKRRRRSPRKDHPCAGRPTALPPGPRHAFAQASFGWPRRYCRLRTESSSAALLFVHYTPSPLRRACLRSVGPCPPACFTLLEERRNPPQERRLNRGHGLTKAEPDPR